MGIRKFAKNGVSRRRYWSTARFRTRVIVAIRLLISSLLMSAICKICSHPERKAIDEALARESSKTQRQKLADRYAVSERSVYRHTIHHLNGPLTPKHL